MIGNIQNEKLNYLFRLYDLNRNGVIDYPDFTQYIENFSRIYNLESDSEKYLKLKETADAWWEKLQSEIDRDRDGELTLEEWMKFHERNIHSMVLHNDKHFLNSFVVNVFNLIDENGNGKTGKTEYTNFLRAWGVETDVDVVFKRLDTDGDGVLTRTDYMNRLYEFYASDKPGTAGNYLFGPYSPTDPICNEGNIAKFLGKIFKQ